jgi:hypothetical protein
MQIMCLIDVLTKKKMITPEEKTIVSQMKSWKIATHFSVMLQLCASHRVNTNDPFVLQKVLQFVSVGNLVNMTIEHFTYIIYHIQMY